MIIDNLTFRQATVEDIPDLIDCRIRQLIDEGQSPDKDITASNTEYFSEYMESGQMEEWVCEDAGRIIATGAILWFRFPPSFTNGEGLKAYITNIYTDPDYRRRGIAKELLRRVTEEARAYGCGAVQITASDMGVLLYSDFGFARNRNFMQYKL